MDWSNSKLFIMGVALKWVDGTPSCCIHLPSILWAWLAVCICLHTDLWGGGVFYNKIRQLKINKKGSLALQNHSRLIINITVRIFYNRRYYFWVEKLVYTLAEIAPRTFYPLYGLVLPIIMTPKLYFWNLDIDQHRYSLYIESGGKWSKNLFWFCCHIHHL